MEEVTVTIEGKNCQILCKRLDLHIGAFLDQKSQKPEKVRTYHGNVAVSADAMTLEYEKKNHTVHTMNFYEESLRGKVDRIKKLSAKQKPLDDFYRALFKQIARGLVHLHEHKITPRDIRPDTILFSCDGKSIAITGGVQALSDINLQANDGVEQLGKIFFFVLSPCCRLPKHQGTINRNNLICEDKEIAGDLVDKLLQKKIKVEDVLEHPFFWGDLQKIAFITDAFDSIKHRANNPDAKAELDKNSKSIVGEDWTKELVLTKPEQNVIKKKRIDFQIDAIQKLALMKNMKIITDALGAKTKIWDGTWKYNSSSLYDFLRFFRNCKAHYWELKKDVKICYNNYPTGFWKFFSDRYPKLLCHLYTNQFSVDFFKSYMHFAVENESIPIL